MNLSKSLGIITGFVVAVGCISPFCCSNSDIPVHADFGDLGSSVDYIMSSSGSDAESFSSSPVAGWILLLNAFEQFYKETDRDLASEGVQFSEISGYYLDGYGQKKFCTLVILGSFSNPSTGSSRDLPVVLGSDFTVSLSVPAGASASTSFDTSSFPIRYDIFCSSSCVLSCNSSQYLRGSAIPDSIGLESRPPCVDDSDVRLDNTTLSSRFKEWLGNYNTGAIFRCDDFTSYPLPPSQSMSFADLTPYLNGDFRTYVEDNYPDDVDLIPGDPQLPTSPSIDFTIPTADLSPLDPSEVVSDYSTPVSFWWTLTNDILDTTGLKWLALFGLSCAIFGYIIWRLGR